MELHQAQMQYAQYGGMAVSRRSFRDSTCACPDPRHEYRPVMEQQHHPLPMAHRLRPQVSNPRHLQAGPRVPEPRSLPQRPTQRIGASKTTATESNSLSDTLTRQGSVWLRRQLPTIQRVGGKPAGTVWPILVSAGLRGYDSKRWCARAVCTCTKRACASATTTTSIVYRTPLCSFFFCDLIL